MTHPVSIRILLTAVVMILVQCAAARGGIQADIDAAADGDTINVPHGVYNENVTLNGKNIVLIGDVDDPSQVVIDGQHNGTVFTIGAGVSDATVIEGFTIRNGQAAGSGGGIFVDDGATPILTYLIIHDNSAPAGGAGGGGIYIGDHATLTHTELFNNSANFVGGAISVGGAAPTLSDLVIYANTADEGGGISYWGSSGTLTNSLLYGNTSTEDNWPEGGGAIYTNASSPEIVNCTVTGNSAQGVRGGGLGAGGGGAVVLTNCILWNDTPVEIVAVGGATVEVAYSDIFDGYAGDGNINSDPKFADPENNDYHLQENSPCIDTSDPASPTNPDGTRADMGYAAYNQVNRHPAPYKKYTLIGIPVSVTDGDPEALFRDDMKNKEPGNPWWRVCCWDSHRQTYIRYKEKDSPLDVGEDPPPFAPGLGFWFSQAVTRGASLKIGAEQIAGEVPQDELWGVNLQPAEVDKQGQSMAANPFNYAYDWRTTYVDNVTTAETLAIADAAAANWVSGYAYRWDANSGSYFLANFQGVANYELPIWEGFWFEQLTTDQLKLLFTPKGFAGRRAAPPDRDHSAAEMKLSARSASGEYRDYDNIAGIRFSARDNYDFNDAFEMDPVSSPFVQLYFPHDTLYGILPKRLGYDYRPEREDEPITWDVTVRAYGMPDSEITIGWRDLTPDKSDYAFRLYSCDTGEQLADLRNCPNYKYITSDEPSDLHKFKLTAVYSPDAVNEVAAPPAEYGLTAVYPNPFNSDLRLSYNLPDNRRIGIALYDTDGRLVSRIYDGEGTAGVHQTHYSGMGLASGVYFLHFSAGDLSVMRKVLLLK